MANGFLRPVGLKRPMLYLAELQAQSISRREPIYINKVFNCFRFCRVCLIYIHLTQKIAAITLILATIVLIGATSGYGLGVMISASQADDSGSIPGSRTNLHTCLNPKTINSEPSIRGSVNWFE